MNIGKQKGDRAHADPLFYFPYSPLEGHLEWLFGKRQIVFGKRQLLFSVRRYFCFRKAKQPHEPKSFLVQTRRNTVLGLRALFGHGIISHGLRSHPSRAGDRGAIRDEACVAEMFSRRGQRDSLQTDARKHIARITEAYNKKRPLTAGTRILTVISQQLT